MTSRRSSILITLLAASSYGIYEIEYLFLFAIRGVVKLSSVWWGLFLVTKSEITTTVTMAAGVQNKTTILPPATPLNLPHQQEGD